MDDEQFRSQKFQRPFQYLARMRQGLSLDGVEALLTEGNHHQCLDILLS